MGLILEKIVDEKESAKFTATLSDAAGVAIPLANIQLATLTLYNLNDAQIINSRSVQNVLNINDCTLDSAGLFTWNMQPADNVIKDDTVEVERHVALFYFKTQSTSPIVEFRDEFIIKVRNLATIT